MEYIFGTYKDNEILKTKDNVHSNLKGWVGIKIDYPDCSITDNFLAGKKFDSKEDEEGNCYDWYYITNHNRIIDKSDALMAKIDAITPYIETKRAYIGDTEVTFYDVPEGNVTVFFDKPYTVEKIADRITLHFEELEEVTEITISVL